VADQPWSEWTGRVQRAEDWVTPQRVAAWFAMLDHTDAPDEGAPAPPGFHWTLAPPLVRESELGPDGHPLRDANSFLPPVPMPRRMWAGSRLTFHRPLLIGDRVERESVITAIQEKRGRSSELVFVTILHRFTTELGLAIEEEQDLVYRPPPQADERRHTTASDSSESAASRWQRAIQPSETLLFRFSALTFNGHRIHYDRRYATEVEKYPGLVVHAPLIATLLLDLLCSVIRSTSIERFTFKALRPTFDTSDFSISAEPAMEQNRFELWSADNRGERAVEAYAWIR
jgi:3-methylfumaryl-CoA hydratase